MADDLILHLAIPGRKRRPMGSRVLVGMLRRRAAEAQVLARLTTLEPAASEQNREPVLAGRGPIVRLLALAFAAILLGPLALVGDAAAAEASRPVPVLGGPADDHSYSAVEGYRAWIHAPRGNYHLIVKPTGEKRYVVAKGPDVLAGTDLALGTTLGDVLVFTGPGRGGTTRTSGSGISMRSGWSARRKGSTPATPRHPPGSPGITSCSVGTRASSATSARWSSWISRRGGPRS